MLHTRTPARIVVGSGTATRLDISVLAAKVADHAVAIGMTLKRIELSRNPGSGSRYINLHDRGGRHWIIRVSNHRRPRRAAFAAPHFDLVSIDGVSGLGETCDYIGRIAAGEIEWLDPADALTKLRNWRRRGPR